MKEPAETKNTCLAPRPLSDFPLQVLDHEAWLHITAKFGDLLVIVDTIVKSAHTNLSATTKKRARVEICLFICIIRDEWGCFLVATFRGDFLHVERKYID